MAWTVQYEANELPDAATPAWTKSGTFGATTEEISPAGYLRTVTENGKIVSYYIADSNFSVATGWTMEARLKIISGYTHDPFVDATGLTVRATDDTDSIYADIYTDGIDVNGTFYAFDTTDDYHTYRMTRKDTVINFYIDGVLAETVTNAVSGTATGQIWYEPSYYAGGVVEVSTDYVYYRTDGAYPPLYTKSAVFNEAKKGWKVFDYRLTSKTIQAKAFILTTPTKTIQSKADIKVEAVNRTITAKSRIKTLFTKTIQAKANLVYARTQTSQAKARIKIEDLTKTLTAKARIFSTEAKTLQAKGRIKLTSLQTVSARSRLKKTVGFEETTTAVFALAVKGWKIFGSEAWSPTKLWTKAKILNRLSVTIQAKVRLKNTYSCFLQARAYIVKFAEGAIISAAERIEGIVTTKGATEGLAFARNVDTGIVSTRQRKGIVQARDYRRGILRADKLNK